MFIIFWLCNYMNGRIVSYFSCCVEARLRSNFSSFIRFSTLRIYYISLVSSLLEGGVLRSGSLRMAESLPIDTVETLRLSVFLKLRCCLRWL